MTLVQAWMDSLSLLKPKNAHLFLLVTLKSIVEASKLLLRYWWWLFVLIIGCLWLPEPGVSGILFELLFFAIVLVTRPSMMQKDGEYFKLNIFYFLPINIWSILLIVTINAIIKVIWGLGLTALANASWTDVGFMLFLNPFLLLFPLFYLDSRKRIEDLFLSSGKAIKMIIYNIPLFFIVELLVLSSFSIIFWFGPLLSTIIKMIIAVASICLYTNIYVKKLHDQFDLYFKQPK